MLAETNEATPLNLSELPMRDRHRLLNLAAHIKDAWMTIMGGEPLIDGTIFTPSDRRLLEIANFLIETDAVDKYEDKYLDLRAAVDKALDIEDDAGQKLREFNFTHTGPISILRNILMDATGAVSCEQPSN